VNIGDAVLKIKGDDKDLDRALKDSQGKVKSSMQKMKKAMLPVGLALTAIGAAGLKMVDSARKMNAQLGVTALSLGVTTKEMRDLALKTTNVTFPLKEVTASFDLLARAGIRDTEVLKATATAFDTLGDAIGMSASEVTEVMVPAMKTFRLSAEEIASKTDIMTYMVRNSTTSLEDFNTMVGYTSQDMIDAGLTLEDMAAAMMYMSDSGVEPGKVMLREWNKAVTQSQKEGIALTEALGMTSSELETYKGNLEGAVGMTQEYADVANEQYGIIDKVKQKFEELTLVAGSFLTPLEPILAGMTALGPMMIFLSTSIGTATMKWIAHTVAVGAAKIGLIGLNITLAATIGLFAVLTAGLALLGYGIFKLIEHQKLNKEITEANIKMSEEYQKALRGEENTYYDLFKARYENIKSSVEAGKATETEIKWLEEHRAAADKYVQDMSYMKLHIDGVTESYTQQQKAVEALTKAQEDMYKAAKRTIDIQREPYKTQAAYQAARAEASRLQAMARVAAQAGRPEESQWFAMQAAAISTRLQMTTQFGGLQEGGIAMRPITARIAEKRPEAVIPLDKFEGMLGGYKTANIFLQLDGQTLARAIGTPLVDEIRIRTGVQY